MPPKKITSSSASAKISKEHFRVFEQEYNEVRRLPLSKRKDWQQSLFRGSFVLDLMELSKKTSDEARHYKLSHNGKAVLQFIIDAMIEVMFLPENINSMSINELRLFLKNKW